jgi:SPASM domain peptide maturase of grasp-with-spasm system
MMNSNLYFRLHANCIPVNGKKEAAIYDLGRNGYFIIPPLLCEVLQRNQDKIFTVAQIKSFYNYEFDEGIDKWFPFLESKGLGFFTDEPQLFPPLNLQWDSPFLFTNAILERDKNTTWSLHDVLAQLNEIGCPAVELRFLDEIDVSSLFETLREFNESRFTAFFVYLKYREGVFPDQAANLVLNFRRIVKLVFHSAPENMGNLYPQQGYEFLNNAIKASKKILNSYSIEVHNRNDFVVNMELFTESLHYHPGFNRKICVDKTGMVKNYISQEKSFGHIENANLQKIAKDNQICELWKITHDQIQGCRDCCHRFMCVDNAPIVFRDGMYFKENINCPYLEIE